MHYRIGIFGPCALRCAAAIFSRAAAESLRLPPPELLLLPLNATIARSSLSRSSFNCATTAPRSVIVFTFPYGEDLTTRQDMITNCG